MFLNPRLLFWLVCGWLEMPVIHKEIMTEVEWYHCLNELFADERLHESSSACVKLDLSSFMFNKN